MKKILVNDNPWESRVAVIRNGTLQNIFFESRVVAVLERSFFKGHVIKVLPGIQTAFVDIGQSKAGFLHISEIDRCACRSRVRQYFSIDTMVEGYERVYSTIFDLEAKRRP